MSTLGEIKARIILEMNRDDLADPPGGDPTAANSDTLAKAIERAINHHAKGRFFFNEARRTTNAVAGQDYVARPDGLHTIDSLKATVGGSSYALTQHSNEVLDGWAAAVTTSGQPTEYAAFGDQIRLYPTPNFAYPLIFLGTADVAPLDNDSATNAWTEDGEDVIVARAKFLLARDVFRDPEAATLAMGAEGEALQRLRGQSNRRVATGRLRSRW